jgi:hypothetical protein
MLVTFTYVVGEMFSISLPWGAMGMHSPPSGQLLYVCMYVCMYVCTVHICRHTYKT